MSHKFSLNNWHYPPFMFPLHPDTVYLNANFSVECSHGCKYCYVRNLPSLEPHDRLETILALRKAKKSGKWTSPRAVICASLTDPFAPENREDYSKFIWNTLKAGIPVIVLSKGLIDKGFEEVFPPKAHMGAALILGATVTTLEQKNKDEFEPNAASPWDRLKQLREIWDWRNKVNPNYPVWTWVNIDPYTSWCEDLDELIRECHKSNVDWIAIEDMSPKSTKMTAYRWTKEHLRETVENIDTQYNQKGERPFVWFKEDLGEYSHKQKAYIAEQQMLRNCGVWNRPFASGLCIECTGFDYEYIFDDDKSGTKFPLCKYCAGKLTLKTLDDVARPTTLDAFLANDGGSKKYHRTLVFNPEDSIDKVSQIIGDTLKLLAFSLYEDNIRDFLYLRVKMFGKRYQKSGLIFEMLTSKPFYYEGILFQTLELHRIDYDPLNATLHVQDKKGYTTIYQNNEFKLAVKTRKMNQTIDAAFSRELTKFKKPAKKSEN